MASYDLGDVVTLTCTIRTPSGGLADPGAITCTVTTPTGIDAAAVPTKVSTGEYEAVYTPTAAGQHLVTWAATGANAGVFRSTFYVTTAVPAMEPIVTAEQVAAGSKLAVPQPGTAERASLDQALDSATGVVLGFLRRTTIDTLLPHVQATVRAVAIRVALRMWRNPADVASESYNGASHTLADPRLLTGDERAELLPHRKRHRGPIMLTPRTP